MRAHLQPVEVRWTDSTSTYGWRRPRDLDNDTGTTDIRSIGYLARCDTKVVQIVQSRHVTDDKYVMHIAEVLTIPRTTVSRLTVIRGLAR